MSEWLRLLVVGTALLLIGAAAILIARDAAGSPVPIRWTQPGDTPGMRWEARTSQCGLPAGPWQPIRAESGATGAVHFGLVEPDPPPGVQIEARVVFDGATSAPSLPRVFVPEPGARLCLAAGCALLVALRRRPQT